MNAGRFKFLRAGRIVASRLAVSLLLATGLAPAAESPIFLSTVGSGSAKPDVDRELRALLHAELTAPEFARIKTNRRYALSATLVRLDSVQSPGSARATCVVSVAILRDGSILHALVNGRATAEEEEAFAARSDALKAAVHNAMIRVPRALR